jgi:oligoribonuclease
VSDTVEAGNVLIWMDLEMTGLDVERHAIVEIAALATDADLEPLDEGVAAVVHQPDEVLDAMSERVTEMHRRSGLLPEVRASTLTLEEAGTRVLEYLKRHAPEPGTVPLCGNTIGMDRRFLARYLPDLDAHLHYRSIDVSSIKELCRRWHPRAFTGRPVKTEDHRAAADVRASVEELAYYRKAVFR